MAVNPTQRRKSDGPYWKSPVQDLNRSHCDKPFLMQPRNKMAAEKIIAAEAELVSRILDGERDLYYELIAPYERMVYVSAFSLLRNESEAEDCAQEAFLKAFRHLSEFKGESKFGSWLVRVAINEAKLRLRKMRPDMYESLDK